MTMKQRAFNSTETGVCPSSLVLEGTAWLRVPNACWISGCYLASDLRKSTEGSIWFGMLV